MAEYRSAKEVREALKLARINTKNARKQFGKESPEANKWLAECVTLQYILDTQFPGKY